MIPPSHWIIWIILQPLSVGIALANANLRRKTGQAFDLASWIRKRTPARVRQPAA